MIDTLRENELDSFVKELQLIMIGGVTQNSDVYTWSGGTMGPKNNLPTEISYFVKTVSTKYYGFYVYTGYFYTNKTVP